MSYFSRVSYTGTGSQSVYAVTFPYIAKAYVKVRINGALLVEGVGYTWPSSSTINLLGGNLATGAILDIRRETPSTTRLVDFQDASVLTEADLDLSANQTFHLVQESLDEVSNRIFLGADGTYDAQNGRIKNLGAPLAATDAVTRAYADGLATDGVGNSIMGLLAGPVEGQGSALISFLQAGAGAVLSTVQAQLRAIVSVKNFGAVGNGTADDTTAINNAIAQVIVRGGGIVYFPAGDYKVTSTIGHNADNVILLGDGGAVDGNVLYVGGMTSAINSLTTRIVWGGAAGGTVVAIGPFPDDGTQKAIVGGGMVNIAVDGNSSAADGIDLRSLRYARFENVSSLRCTSINWKLGTTNNNVTGGNKSLAFCTFRNCTGSNATLGGTAKTLVLYGHVTDGNVAINLFENCGFYNGSGTGSHIEVECSDSNTFSHCRWNGSLTLHATDTGTYSTSDSVARHNVFVNPQGHIIAKGKIHADKVQGSHGYHSYGNVVYGYSRENSIAYPTIEAYADLQYHATGLGLTNNQGGVSFGHAPNITLMAKTVDQATTSGATTVVDWDAVSYDWFGCGDASANKITAPNGAKWVRFIYGVEWASNSTAGRFVGIRVNGATVISKNQNSGYINSQEVVSSQWFAVVPGDYYEMVVSQNTGGTLNLLGTTCTFLQAEWK